MSTNTLIILPAVNVEMLKCRGPKNVLADRSLKHVFLVSTETSEYCGTVSVEE